MHHHDHSRDLKGKRLFITFLLNLLITCAQLIGSFFAGSLALLSDALHNLSDSSTIIVSWFANRLTSRKATKNETFGYRRAEIIAAFINASFLLAVGLFIIAESAERIIGGNYLNVDPVIVLILSGTGIIVNGFSALLLKKHAAGNMNVQSSFLHLMADMFSSIAVFAGALGIMFFNFYLIDPLLSIAIAVYLILLSWRLVIKSLKVLMQFTPKGIDLEEIARNLSAFSRVKNIHHVHAWQLNDEEIIFDAHVEFEENLTISESCTRLEEMKNYLEKNYHIRHSTFQPEFEIPCNKELIRQGRK